MKICNNVWADFCDKMSKDELHSCDFTKEMEILLSHLLCGSAASQRREKFLSAPFETYRNKSKIMPLGWKIVYRENF